MKKVLIATSISLAAFGAQADGFYAGIGAGVSTVSDSLGEFNAQMVSTLGGSIVSTQDTRVNNYRLIGGYKLNENVAFELGYVNTSKFSLSFTGISGNAAAYSGRGSVSFSGVDAAVVLRPDVATGYNGFFATFGAHSYKAKTDVSFTVLNTSSSSTSSESGTGTLFGAGYDWKIDKDVDLRVGLTRLNKIAGRSDSNTTNYTIGVLKHF